MMTLDITIVLVALPSIAKDLDLSLSGGQWVINAYSLAFASLLLSAGSISDIIGRRTIFLIGHVLFLAASVGCVTAGSEGMLIASRAVQGAGGALVFGTSIPLLSDAFLPSEKGRRTKAIAVLMGTSAAASALGPLIGGALVEYGAWEWIFIINIPIGIFAVLATLLVIPDIHRETADDRSSDLPPLDLPTTVIAAGMLFTLNYGIISGSDRGWTDGLVLSSFGAALLLFVVMASIQLSKGDRAMVDLRLFSIPSFSTVTFAAFAARMFSFGMMPFLVLWLSGHVGLTALEIGYVSTAMAGPIVLFAPVGLLLGKRMRLGYVQAIGMVVVAAGLLLGLLVQPESGWPALIPAYVAIGVGTGIMLPHLMDLAVSVVPEGRTGTASGIANTALPLGTSFGVAAYGAYLSHTVRDALDGAPQRILDAAEGGQFALIEKVSPPFAATALDAFVDALHGIFVIAAVLAVIGALACAVFIRERHDDTTAPEPEPAPVAEGAVGTSSPDPAPRPAADVPAEPVRYLAPRRPLPPPLPTDTPGRHAAAPDDDRR
ncbi:MFS transporter [Corynebacterium bovis]|nr:MFS transporter [Corynebacterium bovis]RRO81261.1 MFS transporter [Corynebacterium bovis]RRO81840.1 MFS transporter [Corynebacterium bovis]RRO90120.1 MFS transporter [Corynebacterium bovis]RRQ13655.1 MFS transporter [Corynebacterium bovis]RRQ15991.1 MFS transporter [Corynebacterium bovis]